MTYPINERKLRRLLHAMKERCKPNRKYSNNYYNKGITVCDEWLNNPQNFISWAMDNNYNENLSIDRIDNNKGYSPDNCRFVNRIIQGQNRNKLLRNKSGYIGVHYHTRQKLFIASICINKQLKHLGTYNTTLEAAKARDTYVLNHNLKHTLNNVILSELDKIEPTTHNTPRDNTSGVKGIDYVKKQNKWRVRISINKKRITIGLFKTKEEAIKALNEYIYA